MDSEAQGWSKAGFWILLVSSVIVFGGCPKVIPNRPPLLSPFGDGTQWVVWQDLEFRVELNDMSVSTITVPRGFVADLASTPKIFWSVYPPFGKYLTASILHDYLYWRQACTRDEADKIFYQTMRDAGVDQATQSRFYVALNHAGGAAWEQNKSEKSKGLVRVIPPSRLDDSESPFNPTTTWNELREGLRKDGVVEPSPPAGQETAAVCAALGGEIKVKTGLRYVVLGR